MSKHYFSKSVFALTVLTATATSGLAVQAEDIVTTPSSTATKVESTTPTSTIAEEKSNVTSTPYAVEFFRTPKFIHFLGEHHRVLKKD